MPPPATLDVPSLLEPIPGDDPAGQPLPYEVRQLLDEYRREVEANPEIHEEGKKAEWRKVLELGEKTLRETSKSLIVASRLTEALVKQHGFAGLCDGLRLLYGLVDQCWDRLDPRLEDEGDLERRAGAFNWLDDPAKGGRFPSTLRLVPLVHGPDGTAYNCQEWKLVQQGKGPVSKDDFDQAVLATPADRCADDVAALDEALEELNRLVPLLDAKLGQAAPSLMEIRQAVDDCRLLAGAVLRQKGGSAPEPQPSNEDEPPPNGGNGPVPISTGEQSPVPLRAPRTRAEAYRQLEEAAAVLQSIEPHSPVPYLVRRAVEFGKLPFPQLIQALIRDANILSELNRELGIKTDGEATSAES